MCSAGSTKDIKWSNVKVGQVLKVMSDEDIPADLLTLYCHLEDNVCYIKTTNLDGALYSPGMPLCSPDSPRPPSRQILGCPVVSQEALMP
jgi:hypothetical protein